MEKTKTEAVSNSVAAALQVGDKVRVLGGEFIGSEGRLISISGEGVGAFAVVNIEGDFKVVYSGNLLVVTP